MLQKLPIVLAQVKAGHIIQIHFLNENWEVIYSLYWAKETTKKVHNNVMNSLQLKCKMDIIFMNFENNKTSEPYGLLLSLADKINSKRRDSYVALSNVNRYDT